MQSKDEVKLEYCEFCGKDYPKSDYWHVSNCKRVYERKFKGNEFQCQKCRRSFRVKEVLKAHVKSIHDKIRFPCEMCPKTLTTKHSLQQHTQSVHKTETKPVSVETKVKHRGRTKVTCDLCQKMFSDEIAMRTHYVAVHTNLTFTCTDCGSQYKFAEALKRHRAKHCSKLLMAEFQNKYALLQQTKKASQ